MIELLIQIVLLIVGFAILIKGSDIFVSGSSNIATILKIPTLIVGLTIVAFVQVLLKLQYPYPHLFKEAMPCCK